MKPQSKAYTDEMTAQCLGMSVEQYRAVKADRKQGQLAAQAVRAALLGRGDIAKRLLKERDERIASLA